MEVKKFEKEFHDKQGVSYEFRWVGQLRFIRHYQRMAKYLKKYTKIESCKVVDICCGTGAGSILFHNSNCSIIGCDISHSLLSVYKNKIKTNKLENYDLIQCDAENLPLKTGIADLATFFGALHHLPDEEKALSNAYNILKPGGILSIHEPNSMASRFPWQVLKVATYPVTLIKGMNQRKTSKVTKINEIDPDVTPDEKCLDLYETELLLQSKDFRIVESRTVWFFGVIPVPTQLPINVQKAYYVLTEVIDSFLEKSRLVGARGNAVFIVGQKQVSIK